MRHLLEQKESEKDKSKAFGVIQDVNDWLGPLFSALKSDIQIGERGVEVELTRVTEELQKAKKEALAKIGKAYEQIPNYFAGEAWTQWDTITQEMHNKDPWVR